MTNVSIEEVLKNFGNASYTKEFWDRVNTNNKELNEQFAREEIESRPDLVKVKTKVFGRLIGD